jgi:hypothetical protein
MEGLYPEIIEDDKKRWMVAGKKIAFDTDGRQALGRQLRSVKGILKHSQQEDDELTSFAGKGKVMDLDDIQWDNVLRIPTGQSGWDYIFGDTDWTEDDWTSSRSNEYLWWGRRGWQVPMLRRIGWKSHSY